MRWSFQNFIDRLLRKIVREDTMELDPKFQEKMMHF